MPLNKEVVKEEEPRSKKKVSFFGRFTRESDSDTDRTEDDNKGAKGTAGHRVVCPNFGHPARSLPFTEYKFLQGEK